jgi:hypothetical protein
LHERIATKDGSAWWLWLVGNVIAVIAFGAADFLAAIGILAPEIAILGIGKVTAVIFALAFEMCGGREVKWPFHRGRRPHPGQGKHHTYNAKCHSPRPELPIHDAPPDLIARPR